MLTVPTPAFERVPMRQHQARRQCQIAPNEPLFVVEGCLFEFDLRLDQQIRHVRVKSFASILSRMSRARTRSSSTNPASDRTGQRLHGARGSLIATEMRAL